MAENAMKDKLDRQTHSAAPRLICVGANTFGLHREINDAIFYLARMGRIQAIGCMVGGKAWLGSGRSLRRLDADGVDLGLTLDLTACPLPPLSRRPLGRWVAASYGRRLDRIELRSGIGAQFSAFENAIGHAPAFVGGHQYVHPLPIVREELLDEIEERYGAFRPWLTSTNASCVVVDRSNDSWPWHLGHWSSHRLGAAALTSIARRRGFPQNKRLLSVVGFQGEADRYLNTLQACFRLAVDGDLLMCQTRTDLKAPSDKRIDGVEVEASDAFGKILDASEITLWPMSQIIVGSETARFG